MQELSAWNAEALRNAIVACRLLQIKAYRIPSSLLPLATHLDWLYGVEQLADATVALYREAGELARADGVRLSFHPDQFVVLGSLRPEVTDASLRDLKMHGDLSELVGADVINLHAGGAYGDKALALKRVARTINRLPDTVRRRLTLENDDRVYHVQDLLPLCRAEGVPLTYDVHHHRCLSDGLTVAEASDLAMQTWNREPLFHLSSPRDGWGASNPRRHADLIDIRDWPPEWSAAQLTVDVEAKSKELAVLDLRRKLQERSCEVRGDQME